MTPHAQPREDRRSGRRTRTRWLRAHFEPLGLLLIGLLLRAAMLPLPEALRASGSDVESGSQRFVDAAGVLLREVRGEDGARAYPVAAAATETLLAAALIQAEDRRFFQHPGIDPIGVVRAAWNDLRPQRGLQGASTLTMQLARTLRPHPRTLLGKLDEMALALRMEASTSKREILRAYMQHAPFGPQLRGAEAAARQLFGKPVAELSAGEAATLAALPKAPGLYLSARGRERLRARRDFILQRLHETGGIDALQMARAQVEPLPDRVLAGGFVAPHLIEALRQGRLGPAPTGARVELTLSSALQRSVETAVAQHVEALRDRHVGAGAAVVLDNQSGAILAYVGSADFHGPAGQNDGVVALRQPGSALKPFVYALGMESNQLDAASLLPDVPLSIEGDDGVFAPQNYDGKFHGPVRAREALGNSYNVPAVWLADRIGVGAVLEGLQRVGFGSLSRSATHYGAALALGDGEVRLLELAEAYAMLAREGLSVHAHAARGAGRPAERVLPADIARMVTDMLADRRARAASFGDHSVLELPYPVAAKTGTSKGFRDNITAGYTREITVVTWVGNFDGSPMRDVSGIAGAGPLFRTVMELAMQGRSPAPFAAPEGRFVRSAICPLSGRRPGAACPHRIEEWVRGDGASGSTCMMHEHATIAPDGLRAGPGCAGASVQAVERYPEPYVSWARGARRPVAPRESSPRCPGAPVEAVTALRIVTPRDGARYQLDPGRAAASQELALELEGHAEQILLDGIVLAPQRAGVRVPLTRGPHEVVVRGARGERVSARYEVR